MLWEKWKEIKIKKKADLFPQVTFKTIKYVRNKKKLKVNGNAVTVAAAGHNAMLHFLGFSFTVTEYIFLFLLC